MQGSGAASIPTTLGATWDFHHGLLAGATYSVIAEKLTEDRAREYADAHGISIDRAMKKIPRVSTRTAWDDVTAELEELRRETEVHRRRRSP